MASGKIGVGDWLHAIVDGEGRRSPIHHMHIEQVTALITGPAGSSVTLIISKDASME